MTVANTNTGVNANNRHHGNVFTRPLFWLTALLYVAGWVVGVVGVSLTGDDDGYNIFVLILDALVFISWLVLLARFGTTYGYRLALTAMLLIVTLHEVNWAGRVHKDQQFNSERVYAVGGIIKSIANFLLLILWGVHHERSRITQFYGEQRLVAHDSRHVSTAEMTGVNAV